MLPKLYKLFIAPKQRNEDERNREMVLNVLLASTVFAVSLSLPVLAYNYLFLHKDFAPERMFWNGIILGLVSTLYALSRKGKYRVAAFLLVSIYFLIGSVVVLTWGVTTPIALLLYGVVIVLAGILLGPLYSPYAAGLVIASLFGAFFGHAQGVLHPDLSWTVAQPEIGDVIAFSIIFCLIAMVSWLFNHQMARSLRRAAHAEAALTKQKNLLETTVKERTHELQATQLEKIQQMYRFAELGQLSTALLHDLANHLTSLTIDIEGLEGQGRSRVMSRVKRSIHYIDDMVVRVRDQLHGRTNSRTFNVPEEVSAVANMLQHKAQIARVTLIWHPPEDKKLLRCRGEPIRLRQLMANLISNAIDAYYEPRPDDDKREVVVTVSRQGHNLIITVSDWGRGIPPRERAKLFEPFFSTKQTGMGMGLYIAKQVAEEHFLGTLKIDTSSPHTVFVVTLPQAS